MKKTSTICPCVFELHEILESHRTRRRKAGAAAGACEGIFDACRVLASQNQSMGMDAVKFVQLNEHNNVSPLKCK